MQNMIFIFTNDNVFFLLLKSFLVITSSLVVCKKIGNHNEIEKMNTNEISMVIIDGKMTDISAIELIHLIRYNHQIVSPIWLFSEIKTAQYFQQALLVGANKIINRPFDPQLIAKEIVKTIL